MIGELYFSLSRKRDYPITPEEFGGTKIELEYESGKKIISWLKTSNSSHLIIVVHGHFDNSGHMFDRYIPIFMNLGLDVLSIDLRNHGLSDIIKPITYGFKEADDITLVSSWVTAQNRWTKVTIFGTSMGAVAALISASDNPNTFDGLILDSIFLDLRETLKRSLQKRYLPEFLYFDPLKFYLDQRYKSYDFSVDQFPNLLELLEELSKENPILVVRGSLDQEISESDFQKIIEIGNNLNGLIIEGAQHSRLHDSLQFINEVGDWLEAI